MLLIKMSKNKNSTMSLNLRKFDMSSIKDDKIVVGNTLKLTLACDHRVVDGAMGAQFLQTLKDYIENPLKMIL